MLATSQPATVRVTRSDGSWTVLSHPTLRGDTLVGVTPDDSTVVVRILSTDVRELATPEISASKTLGLGLGFLAVVGTVVFLQWLPGVHKN
jgi:hypothetical protein